MVATAQVTRRREILNNIADEQIAIDDDRAAALAETERRAQESRAAEAKRLDAGRIAAKEYLAGAATFEKGLTLMAAGLAHMHDSSAPLLKFPGSANVWSWRAILDRASRRLSKQLKSAAAGGDWFGQIRLNASRHARPEDNFTADESRVLSPLFAESRITNGVSNGT